MQTILKSFSGSKLAHLSFYDLCHPTDQSDVNSNKNSSIPVIHTVIAVLRRTISVH